jgi:hypothetical protein
MKELCKVFFIIQQEETGMEKVAMFGTFCVATAEPDFVRKIVYCVNVHQWPSFSGFQLVATALLRT